jgi:hypothetical protein
MNSDPLAPFFVAKPRRPSDLGRRDGVRGRLDLLLNELGVPATLDPEGDWRCEADPGDFLLLLDKTNGELAYIEPLETLTKKPKHYADAMLAMMRLNLRSTGTCFAVFDDGPVMRFVLISRLKPEKFDREGLEGMLAGALAYSRHVNEVLEIQEPAPAQEAAAAPAQTAAAGAGWYQDPQGQAQWRWWDGQAWTQHTG